MLFDASTDIVDATAGTLAASIGLAAVTMNVWQVEQIDGANCRLFSITSGLHAVDGAGMADFKPRWLVQGGTWGGVNNWRRGDPQVSSKQRQRR